MKHLVKRFTGTISGKIILLLLLILVPSVTVLYIHSRTARSYQRQQQIAKVQEEIAIYATTIDTSVSMLEEYLFYLPSNSRYFQELLQMPGSSTRNAMEYWAAVTNIRRQLNTLKNTSPFVENFFVYYPSEELFINDQVNPQMTTLILDKINSSDPSVFESWHQETFASGTYLYRIYASDRFYLGTWISCEKLEASILSTGIQKEESQKQHTFFVNTTGMSLSKEAYFPSLEPLTLGQVTALDGEVLISEFIAHPGIYLANIQTAFDLQPSENYSRTSFVMIGILLILLVCSVIFGIIRWVLHPVNHLVHGIDQIKNGDITYRLPQISGSSIEFQEIRQEFNAMMNEMEQMRIQAYEQQIQQNEVKLRYLSQQIQPHFILNSLNTLYAYTGRDVETSKKIIRLLSQYYRYIINIESRYVQLGQELKHIQHFLDFQKVRYQDRLQYTIQCDEAITITPVPPLLLESFVNNVLKHGQDTEDQIHIQITARQPKPFFIQLQIADQGSGFPAEILDALQVYLNSGTKDPLLGIGICNSIDRLNLIYGSRAVIDFYNQVPRGAVVEISIHLSDDKSEGGNTSYESDSRSVSG